MNHAQFWGGAAAPYEIEQSLRFNDDDSAHLTRTPSSAGNRKTWTFSCWVKVGSLSQGERGTIFSSNAAGALGGPTIYQDSGLRFAHAWDPTGTDYIRETVAVFRDPSAWYHVVWWCDMTQAGTRWKIYVNGVEQTLQTPSSNNGEPAQNTDLGINLADEHAIGEFASYSYLDGYLAEAHFIDGSALDADNFGESDDNGVWRPIKYTGSYGTNGFYLKFDPSATNGIGHDHSGNGNNWTPNNFTTSGTGTDVMSDTPTTNWCTLNPVSLRASYNNDCNDGNLGIEAVGGTWDRGTKGTIGASSGKWYWEYTHGTISGSYPQADIGVTKYVSEINHPNNGGSNSADTYVIQGNNGNKYNAGSGSSYGSSFATGDKCNIALDLDNGKVWFGKNGTWFNSGDPAAGTNEAFSGLSGTFWPLFYWGISAGTSGINQAFFNFGQRAFAYTPPTGFKALNTSNLPEPTIKDGGKYFNTVTYSGDNTSNRTITTGLQSDFIWIKRRDSAFGHLLFDVIRGAGKTLRSQSTDAESNDGSYYVQQFNSDNFLMGSSDSANNANGGTYVSWVWKAGGSGSSNTSGSITSTVSANPTAGFSIVSYTGTGNAETIGHGLGVAPSMIIEKNRDRDQNWVVYHSAIGATKALILDDNYSEQTATYYWNDTTPTSTVFSVGTWNGVSGNGEDHIAYCFAEVEGYSKFGSYTGNGNNDGPFVFTGFLPSVVLTKRVNSTSNWILLDNTRDVDNPAENWLRPNSSGIEENTGPELDIDFLANGFKIRNNGTDGNISGSTYIFMALAENPFGGDGVSPATAR